MHGLKQINFQNEKAVAEAIMAKNPPKEVDPKVMAAYKDLMAQKAVK